MKCHVFVDFDGTIALEDTTDLVLQRFADPDWLVIEEEWKAGLIGSRECMVRQIDLVRASPEEIDTLLRGVQIDPHFADFAALCASMGYSLTVVSDGLDRNVAQVLQTAGVDLPYFANRFEWLGHDRWRLSFPHSSSTCSVLAGNCKCRLAEQAGADLRVMIGDGRSDFCVAARADMVFSKASLTKHCLAAGIPHIAFETFAEAAELLPRWVAGRPGTPPPSSSAYRGEE
ncbi:MAG: hypothetical protein RLZ98_3189 [Pseudomonadota bacterium]|jgi:2,3-diketo-5-methylthio-1-phosphopentane phosphatase